MAEVGENKERNSYSLWGIPPDDVSRRLKNLMEGLRAEFGGPQIEPHIPLVGSIRMTREAALQKFRSGPSLMKPYIVKVKDVVNSPSYYQCVNLLFHLSFEDALDETHNYSAHFDMLNPPLPRLSLLYGNLTEEERERAQAKVLIMDESIKSLSFPITRIALYEIHYKDKSLQSWEKIAECPLLFN